MLWKGFHGYGPPWNLRPTTYIPVDTTVAIDFNLFLRVRGQCRLHCDPGVGFPPIHRGTPLEKVRKQI